MAKKRFYRYCIVPNCTNTSIKTPLKHFFDMPRVPSVRKEWCRIIKRDNKVHETLSCNTAHHVCEDHFDLNKDVRNYMQFRLLGTNMFLKKGVVPHIFKGQKTDENQNLKMEEVSYQNQNMEKGLPKDSKSSDSPDSPTHILPTINPNLLAISQEPKMIVVDPESDMVVEIDPRAFVSPAMSSALNEPGPSTSVEPDSSVAEDIPLAMTCEKFPSDESNPSISEVQIKLEPEDTSYILSANVERELGKFSQDSPSISSEDSLFQPPVLIKEEIMSEDEL